MLVDALGNPRKFLLTSGAAGDNPQALPLPDGSATGEVLVDRGHDAAAPLSGRPTPCDYVACTECHLVECFVGKCEHFRRILSRVDKYAKRLLAFIQFVGTLSWLR